MASTKSVRFTAKLYANRLTGFIAAATAIDKASAANAKAINQWAQMAAAGISTNSITLEAVKEGLIAQFPKAETLSDCGETVKGRFYAFQRIIRADMGDRLIAGEALNTVARDSKPVQEQKTGKRGGKGKANKSTKLLSFADAVAAVSYWIDTAIADGDKAKELAASKYLVELVGKLGALDKAANGKATTKGKRKPAKPVKARKGKAVIAVVKTRKAA